MTDIPYNPFARDFYINPRPVYRRLRDEAPVYWAKESNLWALSRYDDVRAALQNWRQFSNEAGDGSSGPAGALFKEYPHLLMFDPPRHTELRKILATLITPDRMLGLKNGVQSLVCDLLRPHEGQAQFDLTVDFAQSLPPFVIADLLGISREHAPALMDAVDRLADYNQPDIATATAAAIGDLRDFYVDYFRHRASRPAGDDIVWRLMEAGDAGLLSKNETIGFAILVTIAGGETTTKMIGNMAMLLFKNPEQRSLLVQSPSLMRGAVEEALRYAGSTHMLTRTLTEDLQMHGQSMRAGDTVAMIFNSANNDERKFEDPDRFDIQRDIKGSHLAFGGGVHACIGAPLARLELSVAMEELLKRWPNYALDEDNLERHYNPFVFGYKKLPLLTAG